MKKRNIFQNQSQEILALFEMARNRAKVMCVPMDYAKKDHVVMFCNSNGKVIRKPFSVKNSPEGKNYLIDQVKKSCRHHGIKPEHVFFGGEDCGSYADNFIFALRSENCLVAGVNACDVKKHHDNKQASSLSAFRRVFSSWKKGLLSFWYFHKDYARNGYSKFGFQSFKNPSSTA